MVPSSSSIPKQYSNANTMSSREKELYDMVQGTKTSRWATSSNVTPHQQKLLNLLRSVKMMRRVNTTDSSDISDGISRKICGIGLEDQVDTRNADHLYQEDKEMAYIPRMEENHNDHAQFIQTIKMLNNVMHGRYDEEEDQEMCELDEDEHRMIVEFMLRIAGVLLTTYLPSGYQVTYDEFEYDIEDDMDSVKTRSKSEKELGLPSREYTSDRGIQIVNLPIHDPNHYDLEWSSIGSTDELTSHAKTNIRPFTYEEVQNAIIHALK